jgi:hypothetical protein
MPRLVGPGEGFYSVVRLVAKAVFTGNLSQIYDKLTERGGGAAATGQGGLDGQSVKNS